MFTTKILFRTDCKNADNSSTLYLRITYQRKKKDISLKITGLPKNFDDTNLFFKSSENKYIIKNKQLSNIKKRIENIKNYFIINEIQFSFSEFLSHFDNQYFRSTLFSDFVESQKELFKGKFKEVTCTKLY